MSPRKSSPTYRRRSISPPLSRRKRSPVSDSSRSVASSSSRSSYTRFSRRRNSRSYDSD
jgi:hypothetical protein